MSVKTKKRVDFLHGKLLKKMLLFSVPMILSAVLQLLFNAADVAIVGKFGGTKYQSAVGATSSTIHLIVNLLIGISVGANVAMATALGAKDEKKQSRVTHSAMSLAAVGGLLVTIVGITFARPIMTMMKTPSDIIDYSVLYMQIYFIGAPANIVYNFAASLFRGIGETKKPLYYLFVAGVVNIVINIVTVVFLDMHVIGVALGTIVSQYVAAVWVLIDLIREKSAAKFSFKKLRFHKKETLNILFLGVPSGISSCCFSLSNLFIQSTINTYGSVIIAGNTVSINVDGFVDTFSSSVGHAVVTVVGQNVGAKKFKRVKKAIGAGLLLGGGFMFACGLVLALGGRYVFMLFNSDPQVVEAALTRMWITTVTYFLVALMQAYGSALRGMGYSLLPMFVNLICTCLFRVFWLMWVYPLKPCVEMVYVAYPITWVLSGVVQMILYYVCAKRLLRREIGLGNYRPEQDKPENEPILAVAEGQNNAAEVLPDTNTAKIEDETFDKKTDGES